MESRRLRQKKGYGETNRHKRRDRRYGRADRSQVQALERSFSLTVHTHHWDGWTHRRTDGLGAEGVESSAGINTALSGPSGDGAILSVSICTSGERGGRGGAQREMRARDKWVQGFFGC